MIQYAQYIETYDKLFRLKLNDSWEDIYNEIKTILISKYNVNTTELVNSLLEAIRFNYRCILLYTRIFNKLLSEYSFSPSAIQNIIESLHSIHVDVKLNADNVY